MGLPEEKQNLLSAENDSKRGYGAVKKSTPSGAFAKETRQDNRGVSEKDEGSSGNFHIWNLFRYSTGFDIFLIGLGSLFAIITGAGWPLLAIVFGEMTNAFLGQSKSTSVSDPTANSVFPSSELLFNISDYGTSFVTATSYVGISTRVPVLSESAFDNVPPELFQQYMNQYALYYVYIGVAVFIASFFQVSTWMLACERQVYALRQEFFYEVLRREISWFDRHQSGELTTKLNDDLERVREGIGDKCSMMIQYASTFVAGFIVGFVKGWQLTLVIMSLTPLLALSSAFVGKMIASSAAREQQKYAVAGGVAEEVLSSIRTVTAFCGQEHEIKRYSDALLQGMKVALRKYFYTAIGIGFTFLVLYGAYALAFWYGSELIIAEKMDAGAVFTVFFAVMIGSFSLGNAVPHLSAVATARGSAEKVFKIIDKKPKIDPYSGEGIQPRDFKATVEFHGINFSYPSRKSIQVLKNFCLNIKEGSTVALCGASGSGKSTVINLILRFYDPSSGKIKLGGYDLNTLNVHWLRSSVGVVSQEPILFSTSIAQNILFGRDGVTFSDIVAAAKMANAHDFIMTLPKGYDTFVGEGGAQLSGGQKQRIAIARALIRNPKILLLDEATSALDAESEAIVQEALDKAQKGRTTIIVAHRLSTIKNADLICAMEHGIIKEQGTHSELMDKEGLYYQLVTNQMFTDETGYSTCEQGSVSGAESFDLSFRKRRTVSRTAVHESHREISRLESEIEQEDVEIPSGFRILKECKREWLEIFVGSVASIIVGITMPTFAIFYSEIFNTFTLTGDALREAAFFWSMMFLVLAAVTCLGHSIRIVGYAFAGEKLTMSLRAQAFSNVLRQDISWFDDDRHSTGKLSTRLATDVPVIKSAAGLRIGSVISAFVTLATSLVLAFIFGWKLALALTVVVPILLISGGIEMRIMKGNQKRDAELMAEAGSVASEALENIRTVQSLTLEPTFYEKYVSHLLIPFMENKKRAWVYALAFAFSQGIMFLTYAAAFRLGAYLISTGDMTSTNVYRVFFAMAFSAVSVGQWSSYLPDYTKAKLSAGLIFHLIGLEPQIDSYSKGGIRPDISGEIKLVNIHFRYPNRRNILVLKGIDLHIKPGQTVALVGPSGCGKSTIISLIERFYDPERGQVILDDFDIKTINLQHLRSSIALVSQEPVLFNCTIKENIIYGLEDKVSQERIENAAKVANIHDFIAHLPEGYNTMVGEKGTQLSGGQKQRIAIARAIVRNPRILLLDEATSALDTESEKLVQDALDKAREGRTCIVIAHRLSTIQGADNIAVIDHGRIVEQGTHEELVNKKGTYYKLIKRQRVTH